MSVLDAMVERWRGAVCRGQRARTHGFLQRHRRTIDLPIKPAPPRLSSAKLGHTGIVAEAEVAIVMSEPWLSADDISTHLGVTKDTVYLWIADKAMPAHKVGRLWKFQASEVDDWVRSGGAETAGEANSPV